MKTMPLLRKLDELIEGWEDEVTEFKRAGANYSQHDLGKYFSALANEANLRSASSAWLVFGVDDKTRQVVGTDYRPERDQLEKTKQEVADNTEPSTSFRNIHELQHERGRVLLFEIPAAPSGIPISWKGHYYARNGESLAPLSLAKTDEIRAQSLGRDWSAEVLRDATIKDLDPEAIAFARRAFALKHVNAFRADEVEQWSDATFLDRAQVTKEGKLTRAAIILLGKWHTASTYFPGFMAQITWKLVGQEEAYEHFGFPFILATDSLYKRIRNVQIKIQPPNALVPHELPKYVRKTVMEAMHNCVAHQDYAKLSRIVVTEFPDKLTFQNAGNFFSGAPADYISGERTPSRYRNTFLVNAMSRLNMIDTMGFGISRMYSSQIKRYLPLPDYEVNAESVELTVYGSVIDTAYSETLMASTELKRVDVLALDRVQKELPIDEKAATRLRRANLIEGRRPHLRVCAQIAAIAGQEPDYVTSTIDNGHLRQLALKLITRFGPVNRTKVRELLWDKFPLALSEDQKEAKVTNILSRLRIQGRIRNVRVDSGTMWEIDPTSAKPG